MTKIRKAATVVLIRDGDQGVEALLVKRSDHGTFGRQWVFPGGAIDTVDDENAEHELAAAQAAAARECMEEAGIALQPAELLPFAHWTPPEYVPVRFATWFFIAAAGGDQVVSVDDYEIVDYHWIRPADALKKHLANGMPMFPPTAVTLHELSQQASCRQTLSFYRERGIFTYLPRLGAKVEGGSIFLYQGDAGYVSGNPDSRGARNRCYFKDGICRYENTLAL
ncbi:MAG: NUDIX domain-containing protein [Porticoccaceae bacterium]|jgi:8-oxo-dGTP pyrophosphatase MutT (NUDIX family)